MTDGTEFRLDAEDDESLLEQLLELCRPGVVDVARRAFQNLPGVDVVVGQDTGLNVGVLAALRQPKCFINLLLNVAHFVAPCWLFYKMYYPNLIILYQVYRKCQTGGHRTKYLEPNRNMGI
jgi:hypothetical protein